MATHRHPKSLAAVCGWLVLSIPLVMTASALSQGCGGALYTSSAVAAPTIAGNGSISSTNVAGIYQNSTVRSPDGRELVRACLEIQREWNEYLRTTGLANSQSVWSSWLRLQLLASVPDRCIDYATYGQPMSTGTYGYSGVGVGPGQRSWSFKEKR